MKKLIFDQSSTQSSTQFSPNQADEPVQFRVIGVTNLNDNVKNKLQRKLPIRVRYKEFGKNKTKHFLNEYFARQWIGEQKQLSEVGEAHDSDGRVINKSLQRAIIEYEESMQKRNVSSFYIADAMLILNKLQIGQEHRMVEDIDTREIRLYCQGHDGRVRPDTVRTRLVTFFNWCRKRKYTLIDSSEFNWEKERNRRRRVQYWKPDQVEKFLKACPKNYRFPVAMLFFTGIRPKGEAFRIRYEDINPEEFSFEIVRGKTGEGRTLYDLPENFWAWYEEVPKTKRVGLVMPSTYRRFRANMISTYKELKYDWPHDVSRHTFGTCAFHRGIEYAMDIMGHTRYQTFLTHYKGNISAKLAEKLWEIYP